eukprot:jgi/Picre1/29836/NNA_005218.t1
MESETDWLRKYSNLNAETCSTSSEDSYDSEEERVKERLYTLKQHHRIRQDAADQLNLLHEYRERKKRMLYRNPDLYTSTGIHVDVCENMATFQYDTVKAHQSAWALFEQLYRNIPHDSKESVQLTYEDVPWIPETVSKMQYLHCLAAISSERKKCHSSTGGDVKKAYTAMCLCWHPDKFQSRFRSYFNPTDWDRVMVKVKETFQEFYTSWQMQS